MLCGHWSIVILKTGQVLPGPHYPQRRNVPLFIWGWFCFLGIAVQATVSYMLLESLTFFLTTPEMGIGDYVCSCDSTTPLSVFLHVESSLQKVETPLLPPVTISCLPILSKNSNMTFYSIWNKRHTCLAPHFSGKKTGVSY